MSSESQTAPEGPSEGSDSRVHLSRRVDAPVGEVWQHLVSPAGTAALLGAGAELGRKGESWRSSDGPHGVVRSYHPLEQVRVSWHADDDGPASLVELHLVPDGDATRLEIVHEHLTTNAPHPDLQGEWEGALDRFVSGLA